MSITFLLVYCTSNLLSTAYGQSLGIPKPRGIFFYLYATSLLHYTPLFLKATVKQLIPEENHSIMHMLSPNVVMTNPSLNASKSIVGRLM